MKKIFIVFSIVFLLACEDDPVLNFGPPLPIIAFTGPKTTSSHAEAENVVGWINEFNGFSLSLQTFLDKEPSQSGSTYTWSVVEEGVTYQLTGTMRADSGYNWKLMLNGKKNGGATYSNWTAFDGVSDASRRNVSWQIYAENMTTKISDFVWVVSSNLSLTGTLSQYTSGVITGSTVVTDNPNGTGQILIYDHGVLRYKAIWLSNGTGHYEYYNDQGTKTSEGDWS